MVNTVNAVVWSQIVEPSNPYAVEWSAQNNAQERNATFYNQRIRMMTPTQCFDAAIENGTDGEAKANDHPQAKAKGSKSSNPTPPANQNMWAKGLPATVPESKISTFAFSGPAKDTMCDGKLGLYLLNIADYIPVWTGWKQQSPNEV
ncbi:hypothetical protein N7522_008575 [Penicillium canescens]|nr:hypothetical protein N7522_008575 [Penicillium canescens]